MADWELIGVPYTSARAAGGIARAIEVLRSAGLAGRLAEVGATDGGDMKLQRPSGERGPSRLLNEQALGDLVTTTRSRVAESLARGRTPLLVGGDCPVLLGALAGVGERDGKVGLVIVDGHEDAWPPSLSPTGEASDSELGIAIGRIADRLPSPLDRMVPLVDPSRVALLGARDAAEIAAGGAESISADLAFFRDDRGIRRHGAGRSMSGALEAIGDVSFWLHVDLDVLATPDLPAVDYRQPGGITWEQLEDLVSTGLRNPRCRGASVVIYNPDLDPDRGAASRVVEFVVRLAGSASSSPSCGPPSAGPPSRCRRGR